jgi:hypothetical protein
MSQPAKEQRSYHVPGSFPAALAASMAAGGSLTEGNAYLLQCRNWTRRKRKQRNLKQSKTRDGAAEHKEAKTERQK